MKNLYLELKNKHQKEMNAFPIGACFNQEQFAEMMTKSMRTNGFCTD